MILTEPYKYQAKGVRMMKLYNGRVLLADEMGLGKSLQALMWADNHRKMRPVVIVCPAFLKWNWEQEIKTHMGQMSEILSGMKAPKTGLVDPHEFVIINYDILKAWLPWLKRIKPQIVILDEIHRCKNPLTIRTKMTIALCKGVPHVLGLSGTPLQNRPAELWSILHIILPKKYPRSSWPKFARRYCKPKRTRWGWDFSGATRLPELHKKLKRSCMIRRLKKDALAELPEKARFVVPLPIHDRNQYEFAKKNLISWVAANYGLNKARKANKAKAFMQVMYLKRLAAQLKFRAVLEWIEDFLEESEEKLLIGAHHKAAIKTLRNKFPNSVVINGSVPMKKRKLAVDQFQNDPKTRLFIGNYQAAGEGLNLTAASVGVATELAWTPGEHLQFEDRIHRIGQTKGVQWFYLVAKDTIEQSLCELLQNKQTILEAVLDGGNSNKDMRVFDQLLLEIQQQKGEWNA